MTRTGTVRVPLRRLAAEEEAAATSSWLVQFLVVLTIVVLVAYEAIAIVVATASLEDGSREVARAARDEYGAERSLASATTAAEAVAQARGVEVVSVEVDGTELVLTLERGAPTLLVHRIGPLEDLATVTTTTRVSTTS